MRKPASCTFLALVLALAGCAVQRLRSRRTPAEETTPSALLADGDAALERGDLPAAADRVSACRRGVG